MKYFHPKCGLLLCFSAAMAASEPTDRRATVSRPPVCSHLETAAEENLLLFLDSVKPGKVQDELSIRRMRLHSAIVSAALELQRDRRAWKKCGFKSPVGLAVSLQSPVLLAALLSTGADPNEVDTIGGRPLHTAATKVPPDLTRMLLEAGARVDVRDRDGNSPLHVAAGRNLLGYALAELLRHTSPEVLNWRNHEGMTALDLALDEDNNDNLYREVKVPQLEAAGALRSKAIGKSHDSDYINASGTAGK